MYLKYINRCTEAEVLPYREVNHGMLVWDPNIRSMEEDIVLSNES